MDSCKTVYVIQDLNCFSFSSAYYLLSTVEVSIFTPYVPPFLQVLFSHAYLISFGLTDDCFISQ